MQLAPNHCSFPSAEGSCDAGVSCAHGIVSHVCRVEGERSERLEQSEDCVVGQDSNPRARSVRGVKRCGNEESIVTENLYIYIYIYEYIY